ncbi:hypothetical protein [Williamsia phyllosphaerae]|uniref:DUF222 domain-containing protein n=1 Tax=Williamsia phyllosphaerae TaxID=885042 RepID=A0ABQ1V6J0_9NOCA|nr:hypothetical protein [Williamsia phyllosphaerae]GGF38958.1 hypothetical protein GCM10007298_38310 [Williamsia phyllosphaerae]
MTRDQIIELLQVIQSYDSRTIDELAIHTWGKAAEIGRWAPEPAAAAVHAHYADTTAWLMPGHITQAIRSAARQPAPVDEVVFALDKPVASPERRAELMAQIRQLGDKKAVR